MKTSRKKIFSIPIALFLIFISMMLVYVNGIEFCDEYDNIAGGVAIVKGQTIYSDYFSHHMPFLYYVCAIFKLLGANSLAEFRMAFYIFLALIFILIIIRYGKYFSKTSLTMSMVIYIFFMAHDPYNSLILSDHTQAIGVIVLLLEFMIFYKEKQFNRMSIVCISIAVFMLFTSAFISIYFITTIAIFVIYIDLKTLNNTKMTTKENIKHFLGKYYKLIICICLPFIVLILWYIINNNLYNFYYSAYKFNREIYPKYTNYGNSILDAVFYSVSYYFDSINDIFNQINSYPLASAKYLANITINVTYFSVMFKKDKRLAVMSMMIMLSTGVRGYTNFHALPYYAITALMAGFLVEYFIKKEDAKKTFFIVSIMLIVMTPYMVQVREITTLSDTINYEYGEGTTEYAINKLLNEDETFYVAKLGFRYYVLTDRMPCIYPSVALPWMYEALGERDMVALVTDSPKVVIYDQNYEIWGYKITNYAPEIVEYIINNYIPLSNQFYPTVYVRNDFYEEACNIMEVGEATKPLGVVQDKETVSQIFVADKSVINSISVLMGTYMRTNKGICNIVLTDVTSNYQKYQTTINIETIKDNLYNEISFPCELEIGHQYKISLTFTYNKLDDFVTIYRTKDGSATENRYAIVDDQIQNYNLCIRFYN